MDLMDAKPSDEELVRAAWGDNPVGLGILFERYRLSLYALAIRILGSRMEAEDAVQETFLIALRKLDQVSEPGAVGAWLHRVLRNVCWLRLRTVRREVLTDEPLLNPTWSAVETSVEESIDRMVLRDWIWTALNQLPETLRVTAMLRYFSRPAAYTDIAAVLGVPMGTVRSRLNQVKTRLAEALLTAAGLAQESARKMEQACALQYTSALAEINQGSGFDRFAATFAEDLRLILADGGVYNRKFLMEDFEEVLRVGVKIHLANLMVSGNLLILEANFENPPENLYHCPPATTQVHILRDGLTHNLRLYFYSLDSLE